MAVRHELEFLAKNLEFTRELIILFLQSKNGPPEKAKAFSTYRGLDAGFGDDRASAPAPDPTP